MSPAQGPVQDGEAGSGEEEPRVGAGEEGAPPAAGQVSAGGVGGGGGVLATQGPGGSPASGVPGGLVVFPEMLLFFPPLLLLHTGRSDLTLSTPAASASPASEQAAASSGTAREPHSCELCHRAQALASGGFSAY